MSGGDQIKPLLAIFRRLLLPGATVLTVTLAAAAPAQADLAQASAGPEPANPWTMCAKATNFIERQEGIPRQLLRAISKIESGRLHPRKKIAMAWPWTVMAEGRGRYLATKEAAIAEVAALKARGVRNIDVGCMQINLQYHPEAFRDLEEAFDPIANVTYSAQFLKSLATEHRTWSKAVAYYHSANPERYKAYRVKVKQAWRIERRKYLAALENARTAPAPERLGPQLAAWEMPRTELEAYANRRTAGLTIPHHPPIRAVVPAKLDERLFGIRFVGAGPVLVTAESAQAMLTPIALVFGRDGPVRKPRGV